MPSKPSRTWFRWKCDYDDFIEQLQKSDEYKHIIDQYGKHTILNNLIVTDYGDIGGKPEVCWGVNDVRQEYNTDTYEKKTL